jgi:uncharacterized protein YqjF (DUF2071 family)
VETTPSAIVHTPPTPPDASGEPFLTAEWRDLVMMNWRIDPDLVRPLVPAGTEIDYFDGHTFVSLVGFMFLSTRVRGWQIPWHRDFEEVNLRFYVARRVNGELRRGVCFIKEIVPRRAVATLARRRYNEPYEWRRMRHAIVRDSSLPDVAPRRVEYGWERVHGSNRWCTMRIHASGEAYRPAPKSEAAFITEHYWGYTRQRDGSTFEYRVWHPSWRHWSVYGYEVNAAVEELYGPAFAEVLSRPADSVLLAEGSEISVYPPVRT